MAKMEIAVGLGSVLERFKIKSSARRLCETSGRFFGDANNSEGCHAA